jgi:hypothetical protein
MAHAHGQEPEDRTGLLEVEEPGREPIINLPGGSLAKVRSAPMATKFRAAPK